MLSGGSLLASKQPQAALAPLAAAVCKRARGEPSWSLRGRCGRYPGGVSRPPIALGGRVWRHISILKSCRKTILLCLLCSLHLQPAASSRGLGTGDLLSDPPGARAPSAPAHPGAEPGIGSTTHPAELRCPRSRYQQRHAPSRTAVPLASAAFSSSSPTGASPACAGWGEISRC